MTNKFDSSCMLTYALDCIVKDGYTTFPEPEYKVVNEPLVKVKGYTSKTEYYTG